MKRFTIADWKSWPPEEDAETGDTVVEPDVFALCDTSKVQEDGIHGAPDFVAEVLSESTAHKDFGIKRDLYERAGVREYCIKPCAIFHPLPCPAVGLSVY